MPSRPSIPTLLAAAAPSFSFEFFPPKDDAAEEGLWHTIRALERVQPAFVSVTYGAGGSSRDRTVRMTERIAHETTLLPLAHLTCVAASVDDLRSVIGEYAAAGVRDILAIRGDPPGNVGGDWVPHPNGLDHAEQLVALVRQLGDFTVGVAAFPDLHPQAGSFEEGVDVLVRKAQAGASFAITQMVFDVDAYLRLRDALAARCDLPLVPGLMPIQNLKQVARMAELMGTPLPAAVTERLERFATDPAGLRAGGVAIATEHASRLLAEGAPGVHFITMNRSSATLQVYRNLVGDAPGFVAALEPGGGAEGVEGSGVESAVSGPGRDLASARAFLADLAAGQVEAAARRLGDGVVLDVPGAAAPPVVGDWLRAADGLAVERVVYDGRQVVAWVSWAATGAHRVYFLTFGEDGVVSGIVDVGG